MTSPRRCWRGPTTTSGEESVGALTPWAVEFRYGEASEDDLDCSRTLALLDGLRAWVVDSLG